MPGRRIARMLVNVHTPHCRPQMSPPQYILEADISSQQTQPVLADKSNTLRTSYWPQSGSTVASWLHLHSSCRNNKAKTLQA